VAPTGYPEELLALSKTFGQAHPGAWWKSSGAIPRILERKMLIVLTGERGAGKSTLLMRIAYSLREPGGIVSTRVSPRVLEAVALPSFERFALAGEGGRSEGADTDIKFRSYFFRASAISKANEIIARTGNANVLIVDEIGFWELEGGGFSQNSGMIASRELPTILSVRKEAVYEICEKWKLKPALVADLSLLGADRTFNILRDALQSDGGGVACLSEEQAWNEMARRASCLSPRQERGELQVQK
jgi:nucleoside-triphosphatase THEP1